MRKNPSKAEKQLWNHLKDNQLNNYRFRRQHIIGNQYIVDFVCFEKGLVIELDGDSHGQRKNYDAKRDTFLQKEGYHVLRFWNPDVYNNKDYVLQKIGETLQLLPPGGGAGDCEERSSEAEPWGGVLLCSDRASTNALPRLACAPAGLASSAPPSGGSRLVVPLNDLLDALHLTGYFLQTRVFEPQNRRIPHARTQFIEQMMNQKMEATS